MSLFLFVSSCVSASPGLPAIGAGGALVQPSYGQRSYSMKATVHSVPPHSSIQSRLCAGILLGFALGLGSASAQDRREGNALRVPPEWTGGVLTAAPATQSVWPGSTTALLAINGSVPSPTIRVQKEQTFTARIENSLTNDLVVHWHGIVAPPSMDGHPRDAVAPGQNYSVSFPVRQRAGTYFYHPHTEPLTGNLVYRGLAGGFIIEDPAERSLGLPSGDHDVLLLVQDKRLRSDRQLVYEPSMMDTMTGYLGDTILVNGTPDAYFSVDRSLYRLRLVNGSNARVYKLGFSDGRSFHVIATDGGLIEAPVRANSAFLAPGERLEILVDFSTNQLGDKVTLRTLEFNAGMMAGMGSGGLGHNGLTNSSMSMSSMSCLITNMMMGGMDMDGMPLTNGSWTMTCSGMMTMITTTNVMGQGMDGTNVSFTGMMSCMVDTNAMGGNGMGEMVFTNSTWTMSCTGTVSTITMTNVMGQGMSGTNMGFAGTMTCVSGTNAMGANGMGEMVFTNGTWTMSCTGMMAMMGQANSMGSGMDVPDQMRHTNMMTGSTPVIGMTMMMNGGMMGGGQGMGSTTGGGMMPGEALGGMDMGTNAMGDMTMVSTQGLPMDILRFYVDRSTTGTSASVVPTALSQIPRHDPAQAQRTRTFMLGMNQMTHTINGATFDMNRVDFQVPFGELEIWEFRNETDEIHPMHPHGALFQVLDRNGNTNLPPENLGWKDTVLVWPNETVRVLIRFDAYAGLFVSHCHNLEHEDSGMMQNLEVVPRLGVARQGNRMALSFPAKVTDHVLEMTSSLGPGATWTQITEAPVVAGDQAVITVPQPSGNRFFRLMGNGKPGPGGGPGGDPHSGHHP